jgi:hypothetical protein
VAVLYLTIFGALKLYHLIPAPAAFVLLVFVAALGSFLAVRQDSLVFAIFAAAGGFLAPILASTGQGSHVLLFSYYLLLNASIVGIAWFKAWRPLNAVGFLFTALIGLAWGVRSYTPELFSTTEPFLVAFFLMYIAIAILFARKATDMTTNQAAVDASIVFGNPIFAFGLQAGIVKHIEFGLAFSSVAAAAIYLVLASFLRPRDSTTSARASDSRYALLFECFLALGVVFATLAIPLALDARWTSAAWAIEGTALIWVGLRQNRKLARAFGMLLELGAGISFFLGYTRMPPGPPLADAVFVGSMVMALSGLITWRLLAGPRADTEPEKAGAPFVFLWSMGWLIVAGGHEIETFVPSQYRAAAWIMFATTIALVFGLAHLRWQWREAQWPSWALPPVLFVLAAIVVVERIHPFGDFRWLAWTYAIAANYFLLARVAGKEWSGAGVLHVISAALVALVGSVELEWLAAQNTAPGTAWALASRLVIPSLLVFWISARAMDDRWPVRDHPGAYRIGAVGVLFAAMALWSLHVNLSHGGGSEPLPYFPLLNALDLAHILGILAAITAIRAARRSDLEAPAWLTPKLAWTAVGVLGFIWAELDAAEDHPPLGGRLVSPVLVVALGAGAGGALGLLGVPGALAHGLRHTHAAPAALADRRHVDGGRDPEARGRGPLASLGHRAHRVLHRRGRADARHRLLLARAAAPQGGRMRKWMVVCLLALSAHADSPF